MKKSLIVSPHKSRKLSISTVTGVADNRPKIFNTTWGELIADCSKPKIRGKLKLKKYLKADKATRDKQKDGNGIIGGVFSKENTREYPYLKSCCIVFLDLDKGEYEFDELVNILRRLKIECVVLTTYSHHPDKCNKYRVIVLLDKPLKTDFKSTYEQIVAYFESSINVEIDKACRTPNQVFYTPSCPPGGEGYFRIRHIQGKPLCIEDFKISIPTADILEKSLTTVPKDCCRPGDDYNSRATFQSISALMKPLGWTVSSVKGELGHLSRPGKEKGISASYGFHGTKYLYIHSTDQAIRPFVTRKSYTPFAIYALAKHGGDFNAAARKLAAEGYGKQNHFDSGQNWNLIKPTPTDCPILHEDALPGWVGEFVKLGTEHSEAHEAALLITLLLRLAAEFIGPHVEIGDSKQRARTNAVIVGSTSRARKGTSSKPVEKLFSGLENTSPCTPGPLSSGEGLIFAVRDEQLVFDKNLGHEVVKDSGVTDKRLFVLEEEFGAALSCTKREGNTLSATLRGFFDDGNADPLTKHSKIKATGAHVVIVGHITTVELASLLDRVQTANGFANRFLWVLVHRPRHIAMPIPMPHEKVERFKGIITKRIEAAKKLEAVRMSEKTLHLWKESYPYLTNDYAGAAGAVLSRSEAHTIRLALIYALAAGHDEIKTQDLKAALALIKYSQESVFKIFKDQQGDKRKEKIIHALLNAPKNKMSLSEISSTVFNRNTSSAEIEKLLGDMESSGLLTIKTVKTAGAPKKVVRLVTKDST